MKTRCVVSLMVLAAFMFVSQPAIADDLADLKAAHKMMMKAFATGDVETGFSYFHEGFVYMPATRGFPTVMNLARAKPGWIKFWETHIWIPRWYKTDFRVIGNTGLIWGVREVTTINKKTGTGKRRFQKFCGTWLKSDGKWKVVMAHSSDIPSTMRID
jgi:ketosteroid isomerase-like protein